MAGFVYVAVLIKYIWEQYQLLTHLGAVAMGILSQRMHALVIFYKAGTHVPPPHVQTQTKLPSSNQSPKN